MDQVGTREGYASDVGRVRRLPWAGWVWPSLLLGLAAAVRGFRIGEESYWFDELCSVLQAREPLAAMLADLIRQDVHPPLYPVLLWTWMRLFGETEAATRSLSALAGTLAVLPMFALGRHLFDRWTACLGAALLVVNAFAVYYARESRGYSVLLLAGLTASWLLVRWVDDPANRWWGRAYIACAIAVAYTHVFGLWLLLGHGVYVLGFVPEARRAFIRASVIVLAAFAPWLPVLIWQAWRVQRGFWIPAPSVETAAGWLWAWSGFNTGAAVVLVAAALAGTARLWQQRLSAIGTARRTALPFLGLWLAGTLLVPALVSLVAQPILHAKATILVLGPFLLLAGHGLRRLPGRQGAASVAVVLALLAADLPRQVHDASRKEQWRELAALARRESALGTHIVAAAEHERYLAYYLGETPVTWLCTREDVLGLGTLAGPAAGDILYLKVRDGQDDCAARLERTLQRVAEQRLVGAAAVRFQYSERPASSTM